MVKVTWKSSWYIYIYDFTQLQFDWMKELTNCEKSDLYRLIQTIYCVSRFLSEYVSAPIRFVDMVNFDYFPSQKEIIHQCINIAQ